MWIIVKSVCNMELSVAVYIIFIYIIVSNKLWINIGCLSWDFYYVCHLTRTKLGWVWLIVMTFIDNITR